MQWKEKPIKDAIVPDVPPIEEFIKTMWLTAYPMGSNLRKLQRDVAFRMKTRKFRKKLDYQELMPIVGKLEREGFLKTKISTSGKCLIYRDKDCINVENPFIIRYSETSESSAPIEPQPIADEVLVGPTNA